MHTCASAGASMHACVHLHICICMHPSRPQAPGPNDELCASHPSKPRVFCFYRDFCVQPLSPLRFYSRLRWRRKTKAKPLVSTWISCRRLVFIGDILSAETCWNSCVSRFKFHHFYANLDNRNVVTYFTRLFFVLLAIYFSIYLNVIPFCVEDHSAFNKWAIFGHHHSSSSYQVAWLKFILPFGWRAWFKFSLSQRLPR